jgi:hypothetical protein
MQYIAFYTLYSLHCIWCIALYAFIICIALYALHYMHCIICIALYALHYMHCIICIVFHAMYYMHCIPWMSVYTLHYMHCIICIVFYALHSIHIIHIMHHFLWNLHCSLLSLSMLFILGICSRQHSSCLLFICNYLYRSWSIFLFAYCSVQLVYLHLNIKISDNPSNILHHSLSI